ncbi:unnamed protein product [Sphagnum balticum]
MGRRTQAAVDSKQVGGGRRRQEASNDLSTLHQVIVVAAAKYRVSEIIAKLAQATCMGCMHLDASGAGRHY